MPQSWDGPFMRGYAQVEPESIWLRRKEDKSGVAEAASGPSTPELNSSWGGPGRVGLNFGLFVKRSVQKKRGRRRERSPKPQGRLNSRPSPALRPLLTEGGEGPPGMAGWVRAAAPLLHAVQPRPRREHERCPWRAWRRQRRRGIIPSEFPKYFASQGRRGGTYNGRGSRDGGMGERRWRLRWRCFFVNATAEAADVLTPNARANSAVS